MLLANKPEHTIPRTNNNMEQFFRKLRRNVRKRCGIDNGFVYAKGFKTTEEKGRLYENLVAIELKRILLRSLI